MIFRYRWTISPLSLTSITSCRGLFLVFLVTLAGQPEDAPGPGLAAGLSENFGLEPWHRRGVLEHLLGVVHDPLGGIFGKITKSMPAGRLDPQSCPRSYARCRVPRGVQARHFVVDDGDADRVVAAGNVPVKHGVLPFLV